MKPAMKPSSVAQGVTFDAITIGIIQQSLQAISQEMFVAMAKTAMSSVIYEVLDFGVAITDRVGNLASAGAGIPSFVGMLDPGVKAVIRKHGLETIRDGDIFISNDPFSGGVSHMNDVVLVAPVFFEDEIVAWTADKGHWMDIGGMAPGSSSPDACEIFQEGLQLPEVRVVAAGQNVQGLLDIITANSRLPEQAIGDLWAGISALKLGESRLQKMCERYGKDVFEFAMADYLVLGEKQIRRAMKKLPIGTYAAEDYLDDGRKLQVSIKISADEFIVDLRGNPDQDKGPLNASYYATVVSAQAMFKSLVSPHSIANAGTFKPLQVLCDEGSMFAAQRPAAVGFYYENKIRVSDLIWKALASELPEGNAAGHFCSVCATMIGFITGDGKHRSFIEPEVGGWGARSTEDGQSGQFSSSHGQTFNCPVEVNEAKNGVFVERYALNSDPGGAGQFRGGKGVDLRYQINHKDGWVTAAYTRSRIKPWAMVGGQEGSVNRLSIIRADGSMEEHITSSALALDYGDTVWIRTGVGGGYGDPLSRDETSVLADVRDEYISREEAVNIYGIDKQRVANISTQYFLTNK